MGSVVIELPAVVARYARYALGRVQEEGEGVDAEFVERCQRTFDAAMIRDDSGNLPSQVMMFRVSGEQARQLPSLIVSYADCESSDTHKCRGVARDIRNQLLRQGVMIR